MKRILAILLAVLMLAGTMPIYAQEAQSECEHEYFNACDGVCMNCGEVTREATHELTHVPEVVATDCLHPGNIEYYKCSKCGGYYTDEEGYEQINPWYVETSVDCVRPEDAADCAVIPCTVCGNDTYGYGEHDLGDSFACQGGTCAKCGDYIYGYGCENDGPYCTDGHCIFCGEVVEGWGHENGAWAPCTDGLCAYGCGLEYPATAEHNDADGNGICDVCYFCAGEHVFENGFDPCYGGTCSRCWAYFEGEHSYDNACDVDCNVCGENREVEHTLVHVPAVEGSCIQQGNIEYWYCEVCGSAWLDAECTLNTNLKSVVLVGASHPERYVVHVEAKPATCFEDGNIEYWYCDLCKCYFSHEYMRPYQEINVSATVLPAEHTFANPCDTYCVVCEEDVRDPNHTLTYVPCVEPVDCQTPGNIEHWYCEVCEGYFNDENGVNQLNPWYIPITADCVRPEGSADCASVNCLVCGEEIYGYGEHDLGESFPCQGGTCLKCGQKIEGYGCVNYDTPACMDGVCYYCGGFVAGLGHENGAWAPCMKGECSYGCGLEYPATAEHEDNEGDGYCDVCWSHLNHTFENGFDPCLGGECSVCWTFVEGKHEYFYPCDPVCINCYEITNPDAAHSVIHVEAKEPTCLESGNIEYWYCEFCGATWLDAECTLNTNLKAIMLPSPNPVIIHVEAKAPTCTENGNIEYWYCELCGYAWLDAECTLNTNLKAVILPAEHTFANPCDTYCVVCEEDVRDPNHTLTYVPCVEPVDCQTPGNIEHWYCEVCEGYFNDENGVNQLNPWYIPITADCVRPEGSADCASVNCLVCGEEIYGYGDHDLGESFPCQGGTCLKCGQKIEGYGCANYDTPACMDGVCYYCGGFVAGLGHENGAWAPCMKGECSYGCGLEYPATAEHVDNEGDGYCDTCWSHLNHTFENGFDPCYGGECSICWTFVAGEHDFEDEFTVDKAPTEEETGLESRHCKNCEAVTDETEIPTIMRGDVNGDGEVTAKDSIAIKKYIKGITDDISFYNADMNGDDEISAKDSNLLKKYLSSF